MALPADRRDLAIAVPHPGDLNRRGCWSVAAFALIVAAGVAAPRSPALGATAAEVCRFEGATSHDGRVQVRSAVTSAPGGETVVDVTLSLRATVWWVFDAQYLAEEISTWRGGELVSVAVNNRTLADGRAVRQQWDVFRPGAGGTLEGWRVQARGATEFRRKHPGFARHWDAAAFGMPWVQDYAGASPERRPDLDLPRAAWPPGLRTPLAAVFYWLGRMPPRESAVPLFLPGFKRDARVDLAAMPAAAAADGAWRAWQVPLRHPALEGRSSEAKAWVSPGGRLLQVAFDVYARQGTAHGVLRAVGCEGALPAPPA